jgi:hypothetical protein
VSSFPVLDAEPRPPSVRHRLGAGLIVVVVIAVIAAAVEVVRALTDNATSTAPTSILGYQSEVLSQYGVDGLKPVSFASIGLVSGWPTPSPDGKLLLSGTGQLVTMDGPRPTALNTVLYNALTDSNDITNGFADGDEYVGVFDAGGGEVALASTATGSSHSLGSGAYAIGDPTAPALYVTTTTAPPVAEPDDSFQADTAVERRPLGGPATVVATSADVAARLKLPPNAQLELYPAPDPTGRDVAIFVVADGKAGETEALVVYSRAGAYLGALPSIANEPTFWSASGSTIFYEPAATTPKLIGWQPGSSASTGKAIPLPAGISGVQQCTWSPNGKQAMCGAVHASSHTISGWVLLDPAAATATFIDQASNPVLWVKASAAPGAGASKGGS